MTRQRRLLMPVLLIATMACFHQTVQTGRTPGPTVVDKPWVATWLWGLVPAKELDMRTECPSGVAIVETEASFLNGLVAGITFGIFTPRHVKVTCASGGAALPAGARNVVIAPNASREERAAAFTAAVRESLAHEAVVVVRF
jgi:hypothetical protein